MIESISDQRSGDATRFGSQFIVDLDLIIGGRGAFAPTTEARTTIAGDTYFLQGMTSAQRSMVLDVFPHAAPPCDGEVRNTIINTDPRLFRHSPTTAWSFDMEFSYSADEIWFCSTGFLAHLVLSPHLEGRLWTGIGDSKLFLGIVENYARTVCAYFVLLKRLGFLLHSAAVAGNERCYAFHGPSGAGKSTISHKAYEAGWSVYSDDLNVITIDGSSPRVHSTNFTGEFRGSENLAQPRLLNGVFELRKGPRNRLHTVSTARTMGKLFACCAFVNRDPFRENLLYERLETLCARSRIGVLEVARDTPFKNIIRLLEDA